jgi:hypothetical protein
VLHVGEGPLHGSIENVSQTGALVSVAAEPSHRPEATPVEQRRIDRGLDIELRMADGSGGWCTGRTVRVEPQVKRWRIAIAFDRVDSALRQSIDTSVLAALGAAARRPILVIDDNQTRRRQLIARLADRGMTPLAPRTPLEAIDLLATAQLHVGVCLLAPGFGVAAAELRAVLHDSFPWVDVADITDDVDATVELASDAWEQTPVARASSPLIA